MYKIIGVQLVDYTNKANKHVSGVRYHCTTDNNRVEGLAVEVVFVSSSVCSDVFSVGDEVDILYNKYGTVSRVYPFN